MIAIHAHPVCDKGIVGRIDARTRESLPDEYFFSLPYCYKEENYLVVYDVRGERYQIRDGSLMPRTLFSLLSILINICGAKLRYLSEIENYNRNDTTVFCEETEKRSMSTVYRW